LNEAKTAETTFDKGFRFLGSIFCRSVVLDVDGRTREVSAVLERIPASILKDCDTVEFSGWLSDYLRSAAHAAPASDPPAPDRPMTAPLQGPSRERLPVYVVSGDVQLKGRRQGILSQRPGEPPEMVEWSQVSEIVILGSRYLGSSLVQRAMRHRIPISLHRWDGEPVGLVLPDRVRCPSPTAMAQWRWAEREQARLVAARRLVEAKIRNTRVAVRRRGADAAKLLDTLGMLVEHAEKADSLEQLRGIEGQAAHAYFSFWPRWVGPEFASFSTRIARGAEDPVNVMLNFLYTQLFRAAHTTLFSVGLDPYLGILHEGNGRYAALAADMMEPFRFLVDRVVLSMLNHGEVHVTDFEYREKSKYPVLMSQGLLRKMISQWEERLAREVADLADRTDSFRGHLHHQAVSLRKVVEGTLPDFAPFEMKW
jgi:CRISPR-associated protein Cas1